MLLWPNTNDLLLTASLFVNRYICEMNKLEQIHYLHQCSNVQILLRLLKGYTEVFLMLCPPSLYQSNTKNVSIMTCTMHQGKKTKTIGA